MAEVTDALFMALVILFILLLALLVYYILSRRANKMEEIMKKIHEEKEQ